MMTLNHNFSPSSSIMVLTWELLVFPSPSSPMLSIHLSPIYNDNPLNCTVFCPRLCNGSGTQHLSTSVVAAFHLSVDSPSKSLDSLLLDCAQACVLGSPPEWRFKVLCWSCFTQLPPVNHSSGKHPKFHSLIDQC